MVAVTINFARGTFYSKYAFESIVRVYKIINGRCCPIGATIVNSTMVHVVVAVFLTTATKGEQGPRPKSDGLSGR